MRVRERRSPRSSLPRKRESRRGRVGRLGPVPLPLFNRLLPMCSVFLLPMCPVCTRRSSSPLREKQERQIRRPTGHQTKTSFKMSCPQSANSPENQPKENCSKAPKHSARCRPARPVNCPLELAAQSDRYRRAASLKIYRHPQRHLRDRRCTNYRPTVFAPPRREIDLR